MDAKYNSKVYINPNFRPRQTNRTSNNQHIYINQNFVETNVYINQNFVETNVHLNNINRIFVNPNFIKTNTPTINIPLQKTTIYNTNDLPNLRCTNSNNQLSNKTYSTDNDIQYTALSINNENIMSNSRYTLVRNHTLQNIDKNESKISTNYQTHKIQTNSHSQVSTNSIQLPVSKSRYQIVRKKENIAHAKLPEKPKTIKISKYKMIRVVNLENRNSGIEGNTTKCLTPKYLCSQKLVRGSSFNSVGVKKNSFKYNVISSPSIRTQMNKKVRKVFSCLGKKANYQAAIENIKGKSRINNIPCPLFSKYGKCLRNVNSKCPYLHDKKHVSLCRKFLKGICHEKNCSLSHELSKKKMPTCYFYLKGMCFKENCPYLHVKLSEHANICKDFIKGYCENGDTCLFRHIKQQKNTTRVKLQSTNKFQECLEVKKVISVISTTKPISPESTGTMDGKDTIEHKKGPTLVDCRYFKDVINDELINCDVIKPTRCKLGALPAYIKL